MNTTETKSIKGMGLVCMGCHGDLNNAEALAILFYSATVGKTTVRFQCPGCGTCNVLDVEKEATG